MLKSPVHAQDSALPPAHISFSKVDFQTELRSNLFCRQATSTPVLLSFTEDRRHLWGGCCLRPCPLLSSRDQLTNIRGPSLSRTTLRHTTERKELTSSTSSSLQIHSHAKSKSIHFYTSLLCHGSSQLVCVSLGNLTVFFIPRKPDTGPTPDALLLAPRATERFLRPVKPAGCAQGSKIQQIPGQLSGDSYFVNGHTEPKTLQIFENVNYRLSNLIRWSFDKYYWMKSCVDVLIYSCILPYTIFIKIRNIISVLKNLSSSLQRF